MLLQLLPIMSITVNQACASQDRMVTLARLLLWLQIDRLDVFFKQRDDMFFPSWSFVLPTTMMRFPVSLVESLIWTVITYYPVGLAPQASR